MTRLPIIVLIIVAFLAANCAKTPTNQPDAAAAVDRAAARQLSDKIVDDMINNRGADIRAKSETTMRAASSDEQFIQTLARMNLTYGQPLEAEFKTEESGIEPREKGGAKPMRKFWYAVKTAKHAKGTHFIFVQIVPDGEQLACSAYSMVTFPKGVPPQLQ